MQRPIRLPVVKAAVTQYYPVSPFIDYTMVRIYHPHEIQVGQILTLTPEASAHVATVLRMRQKETLILFNGSEFEYKASITSIQKKSVQVQIFASCPENRESPQMIHLAQGISKGERMEWVVQKAVELGVYDITPLITHRTVVRLDANRWEKKRAQWQAIAVSACEQCGRNRVPIVHPVRSLETFLQNCPSRVGYLLDPTASTTFKDIPTHNAPITLLIGPEGGLDPTEITLATKANFLGLSLGKRILRTETATITALSILQFILGDLR